MAAALTLRPPQQLSVPAQALRRVECSAEQHQQRQQLEVSRRGTLLGAAGALAAIAPLLAAPAALAVSPFVQHALAASNSFK